MTAISNKRIKRIVSSALKDALKASSGVVPAQHDEHDDNSIADLNDKWDKLVSNSIGLDAQIDDVVNNLFSKELEKQNKVYADEIEDILKKADELGNALSKARNYIYDLNYLWNDLA